MPDFGFAVRDPVAAANAGVDLAGAPGAAPDGLTAADFTSGQISAARLDDMDRRILFAIFDSGVFDNPLPATPSTEVIDAAAPAGGHRRWPRRARCCSRTTSNALPLSRHVHSIALIGPTGNDAVFVTGGSAGVPLAPGQAITPLAGITRAPPRPASTSTPCRARPATSASPTLVPSSALTPSSGAGPGLLGQYWSNGTFTGAPTVTEVDPTVDRTSSARSARRRRSGRRSGRGR